MAEYLTDSLGSPITVCNYSLDGPELRSGVQAPGRMPQLDRFDAVVTLAALDSYPVRKGW